MIRRPKVWLLAFVILFIGLLAVCAALNAYIDPFFHYHAPLKSYYYVLDNERSQNDGITRHFDYDAVITGTSMTENFKASEADELFNVKSIKVCYSGATFKEIRDNIGVALRTHEVSTVIRCIDDSYLIKDKDAARLDLGEYPVYLYDDNPFNDVNYLLNRGVLFQYTGATIMRRLRGEEGGVTDFDTYANWMDDGFSFGHTPALGGRHGFRNDVAQEGLTEEERSLTEENIRVNIAEQAIAHPDTVFYLFFAPYSVIWWGDRAQEGTLLKQLEAQEIALKMLAGIDNVRLFSYSIDTDIIEDLDNYRDAGHYGEWINTHILETMADGDERYLITEDNIDSYMDEAYDLFTDYDYASLTGD